jgi:hypothetical protein
MISSRNNVCVKRCSNTIRWFISLAISSSSQATTRSLPAAGRWRTSDTGGTETSANVFGGVQLLTLSACNTGVGDGAEVEGFGTLAQRRILGRDYQAGGAAQPHSGARPRHPYRPPAFRRSKFSAQCKCSLRASLLLGSVLLGGELALNTCQMSTINGKWENAFCCLR